MDSQHILLEETILSFLKKKADFINETELISSIEGEDNAIGETLNNLINQNRIIVSQRPNGNNYFKYRSEREAAKFRDLSYEEINIFELVLATGSTGITNKELVHKTKVNAPVLTKILNKLDKKTLVKSIKVANSKNKKIWLSYDVEPSQEITGGIWCSRQEYDKNLITTITDKVLIYVQKEKVTSRKEIIIYIKSTGLVPDLKEEDMQKIINLLVFDDKVEVMFPDISYGTYNKLTVLLKGNDPVLGTLRYKISSTYSGKSIMDQLPCTYCPVFKECQIDNLINPKDCEHMLKFLKLF
jgi:DNA-directed RNA polymerase III subunit RPC6